MHHGRAGDQFKPDFLAFLPNNRMLAIMDDAPADMRYVFLVAASVLLLSVAEPAFSQGVLLPNAENGVEWASINGQPVRIGQTHHLRLLHRRASYHRRASLRLATSE